MEEREAIQELEWAKNRLMQNSHMDNNRITAFNMAFEALEKQIPKQIVTKVQAEDLKVGHVTFKAGTKTYYCPDCNKAITLSDTCCRWCGQKLKLD